MGDADPFEAQLTRLEQLASEAAERVAYLEAERDRLTRRAKALEGELSGRLAEIEKLLKEVGQLRAKLEFGEASFHALRTEALGRIDALMQRARLVESALGSSKAKTTD